MKDYQVTVEERFSQGTDPGRDYRGRCYEMAFRYMGQHLDEPDLRLVHGILHIVGRPFPHAWIEISGGRVFDPVAQVFYDRDAYYRVLEAADVRVYTPQEAGQMALTTKHAGPWHFGESQ